MTDMTHKEDSTPMQSVLELLIDNGLEGMARALEVLMNEAMRAERAAHLNAGPYQRSQDRTGYANGYKSKQLKSRAGMLQLSIPQVREADEGFYPKSLERGLRSERALKLAVAQMYVQGVSTRKVRQVTEELCGLSISSSDVSRCAALLDEELELWRKRPLGDVPYLILDARYEKVRHGGCVVDCAVLVAVGVLPNGRRSVLGLSVSLSEAEIHWREFLNSLKERGMHGMKLIVSDDHSGLKAARKTVFGGIPWQRCQFHLQQNAQAYVPQVHMRKAVAEAIRSIFNAPDRDEAQRLLERFVQKFTKTAPRLSAWAQENLPEGFTVFDLPSRLRRRLRTTNGLERLNLELARRTKVAGLFPNEESLLRLVSAVLIEISEDWESSRIYIDLNAD